MSYNINGGKKVFKDDYGHIFRIHSSLDISLATSIKMKVQKPSGTIVTWTSSVASDNKYYATYTTVSGDINESGTHLLSLELIFASSSLKQESIEFTVYEQFYDLP